MLAYSDGSEEEEAPYAYWETKSILELHGAPPPPRVEAATLAPAPRRPSQRSGAPSPSLAVTAHGTPKLKRTTTNASLPSPSGSGILNDDVKALRQQKKRRKATAGRRRRAAATAQPEPSSEPFDAKTLEALSQLARKIHARAAGQGSPALSRTRASSVAVAAADAGQASAANVANLTTRSPLRQATTTTNPPERIITTPLRQTPARAARTKPAAQTLLNLSATKAGRTRNSPSAGVGGKSPLAKSAASPARRPPPPPPPVPAPVKPAAITPIKPLTVSKVEEEEDYFDDDDFSFEAALSQLDVDSLLPNGPPPAIVVASRAAPIPSTSQLSDTLKDDSPGGVVAPSTKRPLARAPPLLQKAESMPSARPPPPPQRANSTTRPVAAPPPGIDTAKAVTTIKSTSKPLKPAGQISRPVAPTGVKPPKGVPLVRTMSGCKPKSAAELSALEELARKEIAALAELDGVDLFGDDDPF